MKLSDFSDLKSIKDGIYELEQGDDQDGSDRLYLDMLKPKGRRLFVRHLRNQQREQD